MPTGYTHEISKGITFQQFALNCARAFGALIEMRDEPSGATIPDEFKPSDYHTKALEDARTKLAKLEAMSDTEATRAANDAWDAAETQRAVYLGEKKNQRAQYESMLAQVQAWTPPSAEHKGLKDFMAEQITESIRFDCSGNFYETPTPRLSGLAWLEDAKASATRNIVYHAAEEAKEFERAASRTTWVRQLRASLK